MEKLVIVINGAGGVGKDTVCDIVSRHYLTKNISSITPIKEIAKFGGWNDEKTLAARKLLSDLKQAFNSYNDLSYKYIIDEYNGFLKSDAEILFVHIREGGEIKRFLNSVPSRHITLLIKKSDGKGECYGNVSDDGVEDFNYDYTYFNDKSLCELEDDFMKFFENILKQSV